MVEERTYELLKAKEEVKKLAYYDSLTNLPNRTFLKERLEQELSRAKRNNELESYCRGCRNK